MDKALVKEKLVHIPISLKPFGLKCVSIYYINYLRKLPKIFISPTTRQPKFQSLTFQSEKPRLPNFKKQRNKGKSGKFRGLPSDSLGEFDDDFMVMCGSDKRSPLRICQSRNVPPTMTNREMLNQLCIVRAWLTTRT